MVSSIWANDLTITSYRLYHSSSLFWGLFLDLCYSGMWEQEWAVTSVRTSGLKVSPNSNSGSKSPNLDRDLTKKWRILINFCCKRFPRNTLCSIINLSCLPTLSGDARCLFSVERREKHSLNNNLDDLDEGNRRILPNMTTAWLFSWHTTVP